MTDYYMRADGTAANKGAASGPGSTQANCMDVSVHNGETFSAGDTIYLADDGGTYLATITCPSSGSAGSLITYDAESGDTPTISGADDISGGAGDWADQTGNVWRQNIGSTEPFIIIFDSTNVGVLDATPDAQYEWTYTDPNLDVYATSNPASYYTTVEAGQRDKGIDSSAKDYLTIQNIAIYGVNGLQSNGGGIFVSEGSTNVLIDSCTIQRNYSYNILGLGVDELTISNNTLGQVSTDPGLTLGDSITIRPFADNSSSTNIDILNNTIQDPIGRQGIALIGATTVTISGNIINYDGPQSAIDLEPNVNNTVSDVLISDNTITLLDSSAVNAVILDGAGATCEDITVRNNSINVNGGTETDGIRSLTSGGTNRIEGNTIIEVAAGEGIWHTAGTTTITRNWIVGASGSAGFGIPTSGASTNSTITYNVIIGFERGIVIETNGNTAVIYNNVIYEPTTYGIQIVEAGVTSTFKNNIVFSTDSSIVLVYDVSGAMVVDYNLYYHPNDATSVWRSGGDYSSTIADWRTDSGGDANAIDGSDPAFVTDGSDFHLKSSSPCIDAGIDVGLNKDFTGISVPQGNAPDIGAYEFEQESPSPSPSPVVILGASSTPQRSLSENTEIDEFWEGYFRDIERAQNA